MSDDDPGVGNATDEAADAGGPLAELVQTVRIGQFVSVGALGATLETAVVAVLTAGYGVGPLAAKAVGAELSITTMFLVNDRWTFADEGATGLAATARRWLRSHLVRTVGLAVAFGVLTALTRFTAITLVVGGADFWPTVANVAGIAAGMIVNYVAESLFTWQVGED